MERIQEDTIKSPKQLGVDIPLSVELALMRGLALKAVDRFDNIILFQQALHSVGESALTSATDLIEPSKLTNTIRIKDTNSKPQTNNTLSANSNIPYSEHTGIGASNNSKPYMYVGIAIMLIVLSLMLFFNRANPEMQYKDALKIIPSERVKGIDLLIKSANGGYIPDQIELADYYFEGKNVVKDKSLALGWYKKAAEKGDVSAQTKFGRMLLNGEGGTKRAEEAYLWLSKAADKDNPEAQTLIGYMNVTGDGTPSNTAEAFIWFKKAADHNNATAQYNLGRMYAEGIGREQSTTDAFDWYLKSAQNGNLDAQTAVGAMYLLGQGVVQNNYEAARWIRKAADGGNEKANELLNKLRNYLN
jgi:TPR repeat protein